MGTRSDIAQGLADRLATITNANGYNTDVQRVYYDKIPLALELAEYEVPAILLIAGEDKLTRERGCLIGDWLFYLQSDEVVHEKDLEPIRQRCEELLDDHEVEGLLFRYRHFWGDYEHLQDGHCWYRREIRIVRNQREIHSWESAQSFRKIPGFNGLNYRQQAGTYKLNVAKVDAEIFHYGWVRPPRLMQNKIKAFSINHRGKEGVAEMEAAHHFDRVFDYGNLSKYTRYEGSHPAVMKPWMEGFDWKDQLRFTGPTRSQNPFRAKHDKLKYRVITWIEKNLLGGGRLGEFANYILLKK